MYAVCLSVYVYDYGDGSKSLQLVTELYVHYVSMSM